MKLIRQKFLKDGAGSVTLIPDDDEDIWHLFNLIRMGDKLKALTYRKVQVGSNAASTERVRLRLEITVDSIDYDAEGTDIRIKGKNQTESEHLKLGAFHTIVVEPKLEVTLTKECWDALDIERIKESCNPAASADLAVVLMADGVAHVCLIGRCCTLMRAKIEVTLPRKRGAGATAGYNDAWNKFMKRTFEAVSSHVDFSIVRCLLLAGPGFAKDAFREFLLSEAERTSVRPVLQNKDRIITASVSTPYLQSLSELFTSAGIAERIADTKAAQEVRALDGFYSMLSQDPARAFYGPGHVMEAGSSGAIATLLISDSLYRIKHGTARRKWVNLVEQVRSSGGKVFIFSARHSSGQQLEQLSGVAAVLRFPMPDLEDTDPADLMERLGL